METKKKKERKTSGEVQNLYSSPDIIRKLKSREMT
jgi:hypothetical protein